MSLEPALRARFVGFAVLSGSTAHVVVRGLASERASRHFSFLTRHKNARARTETAPGV